MKVVCLLGSPRIKGNSATLAGQETVMQLAEQTAARVIG